MLIQSPKGTYDVLPDEAYRWHRIEEVMRAVCARAGYREIRTPVFEHTELFRRGVGDATDVVQKEMYSFEDKGGRGITLKPESTAGVARSAIEHGLLAGALPLKLYYLNSPHFRYENPQSGRMREHHQFGVEVFGAASAEADAEIIHIAREVFDALGYAKPRLHINSIGCPECRARYHRTLRAFLVPLLPRMCGTCHDRIDRNPLRVLDCKVPGCAALIQGAPSILDSLCDACAAHFEALKAALEALGDAYTVDPRIVRGLDYYTRTVFEYVADYKTGPLSVCGGGRYDGLVGLLGGPATPASGFGMGMERLLLALEGDGILPPAPPGIDIYVCAQGDAARREAFSLTHALRGLGYRALCDLAGRSLKAQFKSAGRDGARAVLVLGEDEMAAGAVTVRDMACSTEDRIARSELFARLDGMLGAELTGKTKPLFHMGDLQK